MAKQREEMIKFGALVDDSRQKSGTRKAESENEGKEGEEARISSCFVRCCEISG